MLTQTYVFSLRSALCHGTALLSQYPGQQNPSVSHRTSSGSHIRQMRLQRPAFVWPQLVNTEGCEDTLRRVRAKRARGSGGIPPRNARLYNLARGCNNEKAMKTHTRVRAKRARGIWGILQERSITYPSITLTPIYILFT
jgi:hypothetical protein